MQTDGPQNDDELHAWVRVNIGVNIPRVAVCEDHVAPFKFLADAYFHRTGSALARANRGGAKTFIVAILHFLNCTFKPGYEGLTFGATEAQGNRCYGNIEDWCYEHDADGSRLDTVKRFINGKPLKSETKWKTGSKVEIVPGSEKAVSGPHPQGAHADEIELMEDGTWTQSRGMAVAKQATGELPDFMSQFDGMIPPQDLATSTMNSTKGRMSNILKEIAEDVKHGNIPEFDVYEWCIWETIQEVPSCRCIDKKIRRARLKELGRDLDELCPCNKVVKGRQLDGTPRTLEVVCGGKAFRSRGWKPYIDLRQTFKRNTPGTWTLQHECRQGMDENNYIQGWSLGLYGIRNYEPKPEFGPIYQGVDWGGTNPHSVLWFQYLKVEVPAWDHDYRPIYLMPGIYVLFKEIYVADIDSAKLATRVITTENQYRSEYGRNWAVKNRFCDMQGKGDRIAFSRKGLKSHWPIVTRRKEKMIPVVQNVVIDDRFVVDVDEAPMFCEEVEVWQKKPGTDDELDKFNHAMAAWRYGISNAEVIENPNGDAASGVKPREAPQKSSKKDANSEETTKVGPVTLKGSSKHPTDQFSMQR